MFGCRTWRVCLPTLALCACGRFGFDPLGSDDASVPGDGDAAPIDAAARDAAALVDAAAADGASACTAFGPWDPPVAITQVNAGGDEFGPALTPDGLRLLFTSGRPGGEGGHDLYQATRPTRADPFSAPQNLTALNSSSREDGPSVSADGLTLYYCRASGQSCQLYRATRPDLTSEFADPQPVPALPNAWGPAISVDGTELFYTTLGGASSGDLHRATVSGTTITDDGPLSELNDGDHQGFSTLSADGLTILFEGNGGSRTAILSATRPAIGAPFGTATVYDVGDSSSDDDADPDLTNGDRTLVFVRDANDGNGYDVYITNRTCL